MYNVFLVDDEPFITEGLFDAVDWPAFGLEVVGRAENGEDALRRIRQMPVDILITDISMPQMNGLELIRRARDIHPELKAIVLSGYNEFDYLKEGMQLGIENYLLKPINIKELNDTLGNAVEKLNNAKSEPLLRTYNVQVMKDNTMVRLVTGRISENEYLQRAELLGISLSAPYGIVAVLRCDAARPEDRELAFGRVAEACAGNRAIVPFRDIDEDIVIAAGLRRPEEEKPKLVRMLSDVRQSLASACASARLSFGKVHPQGSRLSSSYEEAKKAQEYFLIYPENEWIDYGDTETFSRADSADHPFDWSPYAKLFMAKDKEGLAAAISSDLEQLRRRTGVAPSDLQELAMEMIVRFKMELKAIKHAEEPELFLLGFERVKSAHDLEALTEAVRFVADRCIDSLVRDVRSPIVAQVLSEIQRNYEGELSLKSLGAQYHIHPVYLGQLFQKETGESFTEYVNKYRIERAKELLKTSGLKVHEIARQVGYWETGYFYKQFKKHVGISPTDYKGLL